MFLQAGPGSVARCSFSFAHCSLLVFRCSLLVLRCSLPVFRCSVLFFRCYFSVALIPCEHLQPAPRIRGSLLVAGCSFFVARCLFFARKSPGSYFDRIQAFSWVWHSPGLYPCTLDYQCELTRSRKSHLGGLFLILIIFPTTANGVRASKSEFSTSSGCLKKVFCKVWLQKKMMPTRCGCRTNPSKKIRLQGNKLFPTGEALEKKNNRPCWLEKKRFKPPRLRKAPEELQKSKSSPFRSSFCLHCLHWKVMKVGKYTFITFINFQCKQCKQKLDLKGELSLLWSSSCAFLSLGGLKHFFSSLQGLLLFFSEAWHVEQLLENSF